MIGGLESLIILGLLAVICGIPIVLAIVFYRLMLRNKNENIRLRLEVAKLVDELEQMRGHKGNEGIYLRCRS